MLSQLRQISETENRNNMSNMSVSCRSSGCYCYVMNATLPPQFYHQRIHFTR